MLKIRMVPVAHLATEQVAAWSELQRRDPALSSPFFRPEFARIVGAEREEVEVASWEEAGEPVGFWPLERMSRGRSRPVGHYMNECQGVIAKPGVNWSPAAILNGARLRSWHFDQLAASQQAFTKSQHIVVPARYLDFSNAAASQAQSSGRRSHTIEDLERRARKAGRDVGPLRLDMNDKSRATLARLLDWKIEQSTRTHSPCNYACDAVVRTFGHLVAADTPDFSGAMFTLYFGDRPAAIFMGVRSGGHVNGIMFGFDRALDKYSPGSQLLMRIIAAGRAEGISRIDLGKGNEPYKLTHATGIDHVAEGAIYTRSLNAKLNRSWVLAKDRLRSSHLRAPVRRFRSWMLSTRIWLGYQE